MHVRILIVRILVLKEVAHCFITFAVDLEHLSKWQLLETLFIVKQRRSYFEFFQKWLYCSYETIMADNILVTLQTWILQLSWNKPPLLRVFSTAFNEVFWNSYVVENSGTTTCDFENRVWLLICMNLPCQVDSWLSSFQNIPIWALTSEL